MGLIPFSSPTEWDLSPFLPQPQFRQGLEQLARQHGPKVNELFCPVVETHAKLERPNDLKSLHAKYGVGHLVLLHRCYGEWRLACLQTRPIREQFLLMEFRPRLNEPTLPSRQASSDPHHRFQANHGHVVLVIRMEVGQMVRIASLDVHPDDDTKEAALFRHARPRRLHNWSVIDA
jgi:hypothetical protein